MPSSSGTTSPPKVAPALTGAWGYPSRVRQARDENGNLLFLEGAAQVIQIANQPLVDPGTGVLTSLARCGEVQSDAWNAGQITGARAPNQSPTRHDVGQLQTPIKCEETINQILPRSGASGSAGTGQCTPHRRGRPATLRSSKLGLRRGAGFNNCVDTSPIKVRHV